MINLDEVLQKNKKSYLEKDFTSFNDQEIKSLHLLKKYGGVCEKIKWMNTNGKIKSIPPYCEFINKQSLKYKNYPEHIVSYFRDNNRINSAVCIVDLNKVETLLEDNIMNR